MKELERERVKVKVKVKEDPTVGLNVTVALISEISDKIK